MNLLDLFARKASMPAPGTALPGRETPIFIRSTRLVPPAR